MSQPGANTSLLNALGLQGGAAAGSQAQFSQLLLLLTRIVTALEGASGGSIYTPYVWTGVGNLDIAMAYPDAKTGTFIIKQATPASITVTLPSTGGPWIVADGAGVAATDNITVEAAGGRTINGTSTNVLNTNWAAQTYLLDTDNYITLG